MNDPTVVGIPIGGAVTDRDHAPAAETTQHQVHQNHRTSPDDGHRDGGSADALSSDEPPDAEPPVTSGAVSAPSTPEQPAARDALGRLLAKLPASGPIFHAIGEHKRGATPSTDFAAPGSHVEVGVQGRARVSADTPAKAGTAKAEVGHPGRALAFASAAAMVIG